MKTNGIFNKEDDEHQLIRDESLTSPSTSASASQPNSENGNQQQESQKEEQVEVHLEDIEMIASQTESLKFNRQTGELYSNGLMDEEIREIENNDHLDDDYHIDNLKLFENLEQNFNTTTTTVQKPSSQKSCLYSTSVPSCSSNLNIEYNQSSRWIPSYDSNSFIKCTGFQLTPPMANPVDMAVDDDFLAIADYDNGIHFIDLKQDARRHFNTAPYRICGVQFWHDENNTRHIIMLAYVTEEKWTINVHSWPDFNEEFVLECATSPTVPIWARRKITLVDEILYLLATSEHCSAIWTLQMNISTNWKILIVERGRPQTTIGFNFANSLLNGGGIHSNKGGGGNSVYSDFDVQRWNKAECRIVLCEAQKSQLNILVLFEPNQLVDKQTIKVKRRKNEKWIVQGPKLSVWDSEKDVIVYDGSGKIFWFDGTNYRIRKIVADIGRSEVCALEAKNGWCYALCRNKLCVYAFQYRPPSNQ